MERVKLLSKYGCPVKLMKMDLYKIVCSETDALKFVRYKGEPKSYLELYCLEMIVRGSMLQQKIMIQYNQFMLDNPELANTVSYEQKNQIIKVDIDKIVSNYVVEIEGNSVFLPYYSKMLNHIFLDDYESTMRKPYKDEVLAIKDCVLDMLQYYGVELFKTKLSCLDYLFRHNGLDYFYDQNIGYVFIFDGCKVVFQKSIFDKTIVAYPTYDVVKDWLSIEDDVLFIEKMKMNQLGSSKVIKKLSKKLKVKR